MKLKLVILVLLIFSGPMLLAQEQEESPVRKSPFHYSTLLGTAYGFSPTLGSVSHMYAAPQLDYQTSSRLTFHAGVMASHSFSNMPLIQSDNTFNNFQSMFSVYVSASYKLTENFYIHGTGMKGYVNPFMQDDLIGCDFNDLSIGASYNFGNFSIGASFHTADRGGFYNPFYGNGMFGSPLF